MRRTVIQVIVIAVAVIALLAIVAAKTGDLNAFANLVRDWWNGVLETATNRVDGISNASRGL